MMEVKGSVLNTMKLYIPKTHTKSEYDKWLSTLSPEVRLIFKVGPSNGSWYPLNEYLTEPTQKYCDLFHDGDPKGARDLGRFSAEYSLNGLYAIFVKFSSVEFIFNKAAKILPMYYRPSAICVADYGEGFCRIHVTEFPEINDLIEQRIAGWIEMAIEMHGCKDIVIDITKSMTTGDTYTELSVTWT